MERLFDRPEFVILVVEIIDVNSNGNFLAVQFLSTPTQSCRPDFYSH